MGLTVVPDQERNMEQLVEAWLRYQALRDTDQSHEFEWASDEVLDLNDDPDELWHFIELSCDRVYGTELEYILAAGAIEDFVHHFGQTHMHKVRTKAEEDPRFKNLLGGVWRQGTSIRVWRDFEKIRDQEW